MRGRVVFLTDGSVRYYLGDREVSREEFDRAFPPKELAGAGSLPAHQSSCWPMRSENALAVHPSQVAAANERARGHGIDARYEADGTCVIGSRRDRQKLLRLEGFFDKSGGYGDS